MRSIWATLKMALRAALWRPTAEPPTVGFGGLLFWCAAMLVSAFAGQFLSSASVFTFSPYGLNATIAWIALSAVITALFIPPGQRMTALAAIVALSALEIAALAIAVWLSPAFYAWTATTNGFVAVVGLGTLWWAGALFTILRGLEPSLLRRGARVTGVSVALLALAVVFPHDPIFKARDFDRSTANTWEVARTMLERAAQGEDPPPRRVDRAQVELAQPMLMDLAFDGLAPQRPGQTDVYVLGAAGWSDQDVFIRELEGAIDALGRTIDVSARTLLLINHPDTALMRAAASRQNFAAAVRGIARVMDPEEDVLLVFLTSHGSPDGVALKLSGAFYAELSPNDVAQVLRHEGIKHRVVIVSACYSGVFIKPLADENSIVLTAADEKSPSFGCSSEREWTYFGDAFFNRSLQAGTTLQQAFADAVQLIAGWEAKDNLPPSGPQGHFGEALVKKLAPLHAAREAAATPPTATP